MPQDISVDVAVIGGGIAGIATALLLKQEGRTVAVIEAGRVVERVTGNTTAKVTALHRLVYDHLISQFGEDGARQYADAQTAAIVNFDGRVRQGPANKDLEPVELKTEGDGPSE
ncbi:MAG TPA: FAD-binding oxidoreductase [Pyrinomonadaceae bacterium]